MKSALKKPRPKPRVFTALEAAKVAMLALSDEERLKVMALFCQGCGCCQRIPKCSCRNDA